MNELNARNILGDSVQSDGLYNCGWYLAYTEGEDEACLDGRFKADDLEAIAYWMRRPVVRHPFEPFEYTERG